MAYIDVAQMVKSASLTERIYAAVSKEGIDPPEQWQFERRWRLASQPGWDAAWASAVAGGMDDPGADPGVITDSMILSAVQKLIQDDLPPIVVAPGSLVAVASTHPKVLADPQTVWLPAEFATFTDGAYRWTGGAWVLYVIINP
ncbi:MAG TPA: hypothetical protein VNN23_11920 [Ornithinibacter sp.]|nr:hypothetical protein [Ornithinibacter sp.]